MQGVHGVPPAAADPDLWLTAKLPQNRTRNRYVVHAVAETWQTGSVLA